MEFLVETHSDIMVFKKSRKSIDNAVEYFYLENKYKMPEKILFLQLDQ